MEVQLLLKSFSDQQAMPRPCQAISPLGVIDGRTTELRTDELLLGLDVLINDIGSYEMLFYLYSP